jgi:diguanylate cyclase (GGDEF)-like protein
MVDIDHFKRVNDEHGPVGDLVIQKVASSLIRSFPRKHDFVARYGGEEFAVILFDTGANDAARLAERLLTRVRNLGLKEVGWRITCSVGVAGLGRGEDGASLIERSDAALYSAKRDGRNRVREASDKASDKA